MKIRNIRPRANSVIVLKNQKIDNTCFPSFQKSLMYKSNYNAKDLPISLSKTNIKNIQRPISKIRSLSSNTQLKIIKTDKKQQQQKLIQNQTSHQLIHKKSIKNLKPLVSDFQQKLLQKKLVKNFNYKQSVGNRIVSQKMNRKISQSKKSMEQSKSKQLIQQSKVSKIIDQQMSISQNITKQQLQKQKIFKQKYQHQISLPKYGQQVLSGQIPSQQISNGWVQPIKKQPIKRQLIKRQQIKSQKKLSVITKEIGIGTSQLQPISVFFKRKQSLSEKAKYLAKKLISMNPQIVNQNHRDNNNLDKYDYIIDFLKN